MPQPLVADENALASSTAPDLGWEIPQPDIVLPDGAVRVRLFAYWRADTAWSGIQAQAATAQGVALEEVAKGAFDYAPPVPNAVREPPLGYCFTAVFTPNGVAVRVEPDNDVRMNNSRACLGLGRRR